MGGDFGLSIVDIIRVSLRGENGLSTIVLLKDYLVVECVYPTLLLGDVGVIEGSIKLLVIFFYPGYKVFLGVFDIVGRLNLNGLFN